MPNPQYQEPGMKKWMLISLLCVMSLSASAAQITLVSDAWCPYNCAPDSELPGFMVEAAVLILGAAGHDVKYVLVNDWDQALADARAGKYSGVIGAGEEDREGFFFPGENMGFSRNAIYVRKGDAWKFDGPASLEGKKAVALTGYTYDDAIDEWIAAHATYVDTLPEAVEALLSEKVDLLFENEYVMSLFSLLNNIQESIEPAGMLLTDRVYVAFSAAIPESEEYARILTEGVKAMKADGSWKTLLEKYGVTDQ